MATLPDSRSKKIEFFEQRIAIWEANADKIGLTDIQVNELRKFVNTSRNKFEAAMDSRNAAKAATAEFHTCTDEMASLGSNLIQTIRAFAKTTSNPDVFDMANIPAPKRPKPAGRPTPPANLIGRINAQGEVELSWKASLIARTFFTIERQMTRAGGSEDESWMLVGTAQEKTFTDRFVPVGFAAATYRVTAHRGDLNSEAAAPVSVLFGNATRTEADIAGRIGESRKAA